MWLKKRLWTGKDSREHWFEMTYEHAYVGVLCNVSHMNILVILYCSPMPCEMEYFFFFNGGVNEMLTPTFMSEWSEIRDSSWKDNNMLSWGNMGKILCFLKN